MIYATVKNFSHLKKSIDTCCDENGVVATIKTKPIWEGYAALKNKGIKMRWISEITKENLPIAKN